MHIDDITDMCKDAGIKHIDYTDADNTYKDMPYTKSPF